MNFQRGRNREEPEINLIPMIDVLLVILIFMMVTTSYAKFSELQINLPQGPSSGTGQPSEKPMQLAVDANGNYAINAKGIAYSNVNALADSLKKAAGSQTDPTIAINADAKATHQSVINIMQAAQLAGFGRVTFVTQNQPN